MSKFTFLRHGEILSGFSRNELQEINMLEDTITLSDTGIEQATIYAKTLHHDDFDIIVVADSLRTRKTAEIINHYISVPVIIEPSLNAWKPSKSLSFLSFNDYWKAYKQFISCNGVACSSDLDWENFEDLKARTLTGLKKYEKYESVLIITHSIIISLYTGISQTGIRYCSPNTIQKLKCSPPDFLSILNS